MAARLLVAVLSTDHSNLRDFTVYTLPDGMRSTQTVREQLAAKMLREHRVSSFTEVAVIQLDDSVAPEVYTEETQTVVAQTALPERLVAEVPG